MAKISRDGGPSDGYATPGDTATDALQRESALHPEEQGALLLSGERDDSQWLSREGDDAPSHGNNSSASSEKQSSTDETTTESRPRARTTESPSAPDHEGSSTVRMTGTVTKESKTGKK